ncbi:COMM domain-containing protein 6 isoform X3 [Gallus gallus]|uniref:COMM domain-containing protein 6 n=1 Tax=Gallus gallus TaxID=9031 RepID=A0A8V0X8X4_CHICK|nr:COMM domain-containing protein 6 isoform X3 [Gallus gallus]XP_040562577.1 COMM domain-containing protein 6 isoform X3 [Gallus gallus]
MAAGSVVLLTRALEALDVGGAADKINLIPQDFFAELFVDIKWKLGVAMSSDTCRSLKYPYVTVALKVADSSGQITNKCFEMTVPQFKNFFRQFKEMAAVLETV